MLTGFFEFQTQLKPRDLLALRLGPNFDVRMMRMCWTVSAVVFVTFLCINVVSGVPKGALITSLPGYASNLPFPSAHYGGYITIDEKSEKQLYYYFVTSESKTAATDPVVFWYNGGPGCSSFDAFIYEHGPFKFEPAENPSSLPNLKLNPYSWSKVANVLYVDSPAGVGFSYSKNLSDYITGDLNTAADSYTFIRNWFAAYPEYLPNPFYISGESYAGIYVPCLSREVANGIAAGLEPKLNFKGYMVGNGVTDQKYDGNALIPFAFGMGLISSDLYDQATKACGGNYWNTSSADCLQAFGDVEFSLSGLNIYDILEPCYHSGSLNSSSQLPTSFQKLAEGQGDTKVRKRIFGRAWPLNLQHTPGRVPTWGYLQYDGEVSCMDDRVAAAWLNSPSVRKAIHAAPAREIGEWQLCTDAISYESDAGSMIPIHLNLTKAGYKALIYSGDHDMCVPYTGSEAWTRSLGYKIVDKWRPWFVEEQVAGYTQGYANQLTFATIKGSGHTVPEYKPEEALAFFSRFLAGSPL